eukprot:1683777-Prymnesium_polylepis.3
MDLGRRGGDEAARSRPKPSEAARPSRCHAARRSLLGSSRPAPTALSAHRLPLRCNHHTTAPPPPAPPAWPPLQVMVAASASSAEWGARRFAKAQRAGRSGVRALLTHRSFQYRRCVVDGSWGGAVGRWSTPRHPAQEMSARRPPSAQVKRPKPLDGTYVSDGVDVTDDIGVARLR